MRRFGLAICTVAAVTAATQTTIADESAEKAQKLVDRCIKAIGGSKALMKTRNTVMEDAGTYFGLGDGVPYTGRYVFVFKESGRYRMEIKGQFVSVTDGDKSWMSVQGMVLDAEGPALTNAQEGSKISFAMSLIPLQKPNKLYKLGLVDPVEVEGTKCDGITITRDKMPTITMYFDRSTGLIKKTIYKTRSPEDDFKQVTDATIYHKYKVSNGFKSPVHMTIYRDDKKFVESKPVKISYPDKIDDKEFKKPE